MERTEFLQNYGTMVAHAWNSDAYLGRLLQQPRTVLAEAGLVTPEGAVVNIHTFDMRPEDTSRNPDGNFEAWQKGMATGVYEVGIPAKPAGLEIDEMALSDEMLEMVSGGGACCCCCTPCCCCCASQD